MQENNYFLAYKDSHQAHVQYATLSMQTTWLYVILKRNQKAQQSGVGTKKINPIIEKSRCYILMNA